MKIDTQFALRRLSQNQEDAAVNLLKSSQHITIQILPNHCLSEEQILNGFVVKCAEDEIVEKIPVPKCMFEQTCVYECNMQDNDGCFLNANVVHIANNIKKYKEILKCYLTDLEKDQRNVASFDCIPDFEDEACVYQDERKWSCSVPRKIGIYHSFIRGDSHDTRRHRLFIVITGCLVQAAEALHNLWQDLGSSHTAKDFCLCEEMQWLRDTTTRNHNRMACELAERMNLNLISYHDLKCPEKSKIALPCNLTYIHDMIYNKNDNTVRMSNSCSFVKDSENGICCEMSPSEGYWLFCGPRDHSQDTFFGNTFCHKYNVSAFVSKTVKFHDLHTPGKDCCVVKDVKNSCDFDTNNILAKKTYYLDFDENFFDIVCKMGFNRNDGVLVLMPLFFTDNSENSE